APGDNGKSGIAYFHIVQGGGPTTTGLQCSPSCNDSTFGFPDNSVGGSVSAIYQGTVFSDSPFAPVASTPAVDLTQIPNGYLFSFPIVFGQTFDIAQALTINANLYAAGAFPGTGVSALIGADYFDPVRINQISLTDADGAPVNDWTIYSGSGVDYTAAGTFAATPEPVEAPVIVGIVIVMSGVAFAKRSRC